MRILILALLLSGCSFNEPMYDELSKINFDVFKEHGDKQCVPYSEALRDELYDQGIVHQSVSVIMPDGQHHRMVRVGKYYLDSRTNWPREKHELVNYTFLGDKHEL